MISISYLRASYFVVSETKNKKKNPPALYVLFSPLIVNLTRNSILILKFNLEF